MPEIHIHRFDTFEQQVAYCIRTTGVMLPRMTSGKKAFFEDLGRWSRTYRQDSIGRQRAVILPNPAQGLSFPRALDVLHSSLRLSNADVRENDAYQLLERFGLPRQKATQPIVTLSGGEVLLLNFAKAEAMLPVVKGLTACSPTHWLNRRRYRFWHRLVRQYRESEREIEIALLDGEPFPGRASETCDRFPAAEVPGIDWMLSFSRLDVVFEEIPFPFEHPASRLRYVLDGGSSLTLASPTLVTGDNGVGKSIFAKIAAGVIKPARGKLSIRSPQAENPVRLLFQDTIDQLFGKSIDAHRRWVFMFDRRKGRLADSILQAIDDDVRNHLSTEPELLETIGREGANATLLQAKMSLVAERLACAPSLLILDEPAWGLSRAVAQAFVEAVCRRAAQVKTAVMLISHQFDWWKHLAKAHCHLSKTEAATVSIKQIPHESIA